MDTAVGLRASLFRQETAELWARHYLRLLEGIAPAPHGSIASFALMDTVEREAVVTFSCGRESEFPGKPVHELVEEQATARPDAIVCANDRTAGMLMQTLLRLGYTIPTVVRLAGMSMPRC